MNPEEILDPAAADAASLAAEAQVVDDAADPADGPETDEKKSQSRWKLFKPDAQAEELAQVKEEAEKTRAALQDRLLRLQADFDNMRKRTQREKADWIRGANEDILSELLPVIDHLELALGAVGDTSAAKASAESMTQGVRMVCEQLLSTLARFGLQPVDAGPTFDPARHEAISHLPSETVPENGVIVQSRRGYQLGDRMLRPAQVVVSSGPAALAGEV